MNREIIHAIIDKIQAYDRIALYRHAHPDQDAYGAQVGLKEIIETNFPGKTVYLMGEHNKKLSYIGEMYENQAGMSTEGMLAIVLDVGRGPRVDNQSFTECEAVITIDHHPVFGEPYTDGITWVDPTYPATCVMLMDLVIESEGRLVFNKRAREVLYIGMVADTGRFEYIENPTALFERMHHVTYDLNTKPLYEAMYEVDMQTIQFKGYIYSHFEMRNEGVAVLKIPKEVADAHGLTPMAAARMVNALRGIEGVVNWHFFADYPEKGQIIGEFRSSGPSINQIATKYGGGGHMLAAGATLSSWEAVEELIADFEKNAKAYKD